jgi:HSP20 family protein
MNVVRWNPRIEFDNLFQPTQKGQLRRADWLPLVDIRETEGDYQIDVEVPSVAADDLSVTVQEGVLSVSGERKASTVNEEQERVHRVERTTGKFVRSFQLPDDADVDAVEADHKDGVLYLKVAKRATVQARNVEIRSPLS